MSKNDLNTPTLRKDGLPIRSDLLKSKRPRGQNARNRMNPTPDIRVEDIETMKTVGREKPTEETKNVD
jgi:hypothetical protein